MRARQCPDPDPRGSVTLGLFVDLDPAPLKIFVDPDPACSSEYENCKSYLRTYIFISSLWSPIAFIVFTRTFY
jgi:hypothetical protein